MGMLVHNDVTYNTHAGIVNVGDKTVNIPGDLHTTQSTVYTQSVQRTEERKMHIA